LHGKDRLNRKGVKRYGLSLRRTCGEHVWLAHTLVARKRILYTHKEALRQVFGDTCIDSYQELWKVGGVMERAARRANAHSSSACVNC